MGYFTALICSMQEGKIKHLHVHVVSRKNQTKILSIILAV